MAHSETASNPPYPATPLRITPHPSSSHHVPGAAGPRHRVRATWAIEPGIIGAHARAGTVGAGARWRRDDEGGAAEGTQGALQPACRVRRTAAQAGGGRGGGRQRGKSKASHPFHPRRQGNLIQRMSFGSGFTIYPPPLPHHAPPATRYPPPTTRHSPSGATVDRGLFQRGGSRRRGSW